MVLFEVYVPALKTSCWELLVNILLLSLIFTVIFLTCKGTSHLGGGNIVCHIFCEIYCCVFALVRGISFRHVITSLVRGVTGTWLSPNGLRPSNLETWAV